MSLHRMILRWNMEDEGKPVEERKPIHIFIMSPGGYLSYMWMIVDAIRASTTPVYTVNIGMAASSAALIFIAGHKRFMSKNASVLFHEGSAELSGDAMKIMDASESYKKALKRMKEHILANTKISKQLMNKYLHNDWEIESEQCLEYGVCDAIIETLDEVI